MITKQIVDYLDRNQVRYEIIRHPLTYTAQRTAEAVHISGKEIAKPVIIKHEGRLAMIVVPGSKRVSFDYLRRVVGSDDVELATEPEFSSIFRGCDVGAMPPFGNLYGLDVFVDEALTEDEKIVFNAGSHTELIQIAYADYEKLVDPLVVSVTRK